MSDRLECRIIALIAVLLLISPDAVLADETSSVQISDRTVIFTHTSTDPKDPTNKSGYNLGATVALLPDGRLMAAWFSSPTEGAESQRIMQSFSLDQGRTWGEATVLQDFAGQADFDPALFVAGSEVFYSSLRSDHKSTFISVRAATRAHLGRPGETRAAESHDASPRHSVVYRRTPRAAAPARHQGGGRIEV
ncbi:MAG: hypothetical protein QM775_09825 [Pirellulales bacterium]